MKNWRITILTTVCLVALTGCGRSAPPAPVLNMGTNIDSPAGGVMVREGETLWNISERYDLSLRDIIDFNNLNPPYVLQIGERIKLPPSRHYNVQYKDTLYRISRMFDVDVTELVRANDLKPPYKLTVGQRLRVPSQIVRRNAPAKKTTLARKSQPSAKQPSPSKKTKPPVASTAGIAVQDFIWPVRGNIISSYGPKEGGLHNDGVNIAAARGAAVQAAASGIVVYADNGIKSYGNLILLKHPNGMMTAYAHLDNIKVKKGQRVSQGSVLGTVGTTGAVTTPQLHFEIRKGSETINPSKEIS
jgi:murein DD-endopeptidase MepM/ murein hydrolase activator NlpD